MLLFTCNCRLNGIWPLESTIPLHFVTPFNGQFFVEKNEAQFVLKNLNRRDLPLWIFFLLHKRHK